MTRLLFPEAAVREFALRIAARCLELRAARPVLLGRHDNLQTAAELLRISIKGAVVIDPVEDDGQSAVIQHYLRTVGGAGITADRARAILLADRILYGACAVGLGRADCLVLLGQMDDPDRLSCLAVRRFQCLPAGLEDQFRAGSGGAIGQEAVAEGVRRVLKSVDLSSAEEVQGGPDEG